jgi:hypothetical protein
MQENCYKNMKIQKDNFFEECANLWIDLRNNLIMKQKQQKSCEENRELNEQIGVELTEAQELILQAYENKTNMHKRTAVIDLLTNIIKMLFPKESISSDETKEACKLPKIERPVITIEQQKRRETIKVRNKFT